VRGRVVAFHFCEVPDCCLRFSRAKRLVLLRALPPSASKPFHSGSSGLAEIVGRAAGPLHMPMPMHAIAVLAHALQRRRTDRSQLDAARGGMHTHAIAQVLLMQSHVTRHGRLSWQESSFCGTKDKLAVSCPRMLAHGMVEEELTRPNHWTLDTSNASPLGHASSMGLLLTRCFRPRVVWARRPSLTLHRAEPSCATGANPNRLTRAS
jgi:hypothetical protein